MTEGYIKLWRSSIDSKAYYAEPFTRWQAWVDLLLLTHYKDTTVYVRGIPVEIKRGQVLAAEEFLASRWKWSRGKVRRYLDYLGGKTVQQIVQQKSRVVNVITIVNWELYQGDGTTDGTTNDTTSSTTDGQQTDILKKVNKVKNIYNTHGEFGNVHLTSKEYDKLVVKFGEALALMKIEELSEALASNKQYQKKYSSHYATILSWDRRKNPQQKTHNKPGDFDQE